MSFKINGETWQPQTAAEHTLEIVTKINQLLQENEIKDKDGNIVQLKQNYGNALYLLALGDGNRFADNDAKLEKAINSFNVELCDEEQIANLLPIAAVTRNPGSYSTLRLTVTASEDGTCTIPAGTKAPYGNVNFVTKTETILTPGATQVIETVADVLGPVAVLSGEVTAFDTDIANLESVENQESSIPGVSPETTSELRQRLIQGDTIKYSLNGCKNALEELTGVTYAKIYFNYNTSSTIELPGGVELQPRTAYIVIHGASDDIANVYSEYMNAPTQNSPIGAGTYSKVSMTITAVAGGTVNLPEGTSITYHEHTFVIDTATTIDPGEFKVVQFTCDEWGPYTIPAYGVTELDQEIENVDSVYNTTPAIPGTFDPRHEQDWVTSSGQAIPIYYDDATEQNIFVKIVLKEDAESGTQVENQLKRDLISASSQWGIGQTVTEILTGAPFVNCSYTEVAYTEISLDGETWEKYQNLGCNVIPRVTDGTISIEQLGE